MRPTLTFLRTEANISRAALARTLANNPQVLGQSVDASLRPTLAFLRELGVPEPELGSVLSRCPMLLTCSVDKNLAPTAEFLWDAVQLSRSSIAQMVVKYPGALPPRTRGDGALSVFPTDRRG
jgi:hypothetical protein